MTVAPKPARSIPQMLLGHTMPRPRPPPANMWLGSRFSPFERSTRESARRLHPEPRFGARVFAIAAPASKQRVLEPRVEFGHIQPDSNDPATSDWRRPAPACPRYPPQLLPQNSLQV